MLQQVQCLVKQTCSKYSTQLNYAAASAIPSKIMLQQMHCLVNWDCSHCNSWLNRAPATSCALVYQIYSSLQRMYTLSLLHLLYYSVLIVHHVLIQSNIGRAQTPCCSRKLSQHRFPTMQAQFQNIVRKQGIPILIGLKCFLTICLCSVLCTKGKLAEVIYNALPRTSIEILPHVHNIVWPLPMLFHGGEKLESVSIVLESLNCG